MALPVMDFEFADMQTRIRTIEGKQFGAFRVISPPCPFLNKQNLCVIYDRRPLVCRMRPFMYSITPKEVIWQRIQDCPESALLPWRDQHQLLYLGLRFAMFYEQLPAEEKDLIQDHITRVQKDQVATSEVKRGSAIDFNSTLKYLRMTLETTEKQRKKLKT